MAAPSYSTDLVDITTSFTTNWNLISEGGGGQNALTAPETDDFIQGTEAVSRNPFSSSIRGVAYDRATITVATDDAVFHWWKADVAAALDTFAGGGVHLVQGTSLTVYKKFYVAGNDTYQLGGWRCSPIDPTASPSASRGTEPSPNFNTFGVAFDVSGTGPSKGFPFKADMIRHGRQVEVTVGDSGTPATWESLATYADVTSRRWGIVQGTTTGAALQGNVIWGTGSTAVYSRDSNKTITLLDTLGFTVTDFTKILFSHASNDVVWDNVGLIALGTGNRGIIDVTANGAITWTNSVFQGIDVTNLLADCTFDGSKWIGTNAVNAAGASMLGCQIFVPTVAANTSGLVWDVATDPTGLLDDMTFSKTSGTAHHAIEFGTTIPDAASYTLNGCAFGTDFSATENGSVGDETFHFKGTTGTITLNLIGCSGNLGFRTDGVTVTKVTDPATLRMVVKDVDQVAIETAYAYIDDDANTAPFIMNTTTNASGIASVSHSGGAVVGAYWRVRKYGYKPFIVVADIPASGLKEIPVTLIADPQQT
jgi:hypothetical protein